MATADKAASQQQQKALPSEEVVATKPVVRKPGTGKGIRIAPDFDEPLDYLTNLHLD
jgi:hypothetical protein